MDYSILRNTHDLRLGDWGPYGKKYIGLSHIADPQCGTRFDLCAAPGIYRRKTVLPNVRWECGYHPWQASADLSSFTHRHELEWKDQVYCDISFAPVQADLRLMRCEMVNRTDSPQNLTLHLFASLHTAHSAANLCLPAGAIWLDASEYTNIHFAAAPRNPGLIPDALRRAQIRVSGFVNATGIGQGFGSDAGDRIEFTFSLPEAISGAGLLLRYRLDSGTSQVAELSGAVAGSYELSGTGDFATLLLEAGELQAGEHTFVLTLTGCAALEIDGFVIGSASTLEESSFSVCINERQATLEAGERTLFLQYPLLPQRYGLWWSEGEYLVREYFMDDLEPHFYNNIHDHVRSTFRGVGEGHYAEIFLRPLVLQAQETRVVYALVAQGTDPARLLAQGPHTPEELEACWLRARSTLLAVQGNCDGAEFEQGQRLMAATTLCNCVYPAYAKGRYIRHNTPGRWWDCLYTWDSGFIGLGLVELDLERAIDNLNAYVTEPGDEDCAFVHHGSPVPVQFYVFQELWNRTQDRGLLEFFYPRLKQYHEFLAGRRGGSDTRLPSGLLATWSYFYNSGGWDDYPPQQYFHNNRQTLSGRVAPTVNTSHAIRTARILALAAAELGCNEDVTAYEDDIRVFSQALEAHSWDAEAGYYGYALHDSEGRPTGLLRHESGLNFNMGLDGLCPLVADICSPQRREVMYAKLAAPDRLWTPIGISTVDQSAPYYSREGYWNGAVWMPHQWFFWKTALDHGQGDFAWRVAETGLRLWAREVDNSYNCFEHFIIASGRGAGWHQFGGLSTPVLCWFGAYFRPGRLTCGLNCQVRSLNFADKNRICRAELQLRGTFAGESKVLVTLTPGKYAVRWNEATVPFLMRTEGCCEITLPAIGSGLLEIHPV